MQRFDWSPVTLVVLVFCISTPVQTVATQAPPRNYEQLALEAIEKKLRGEKLPLEEFRLEVVGETARRSDHDALHRKPSTEDSGPAHLAGVVEDRTGAVIPRVLVTLLSQSGKEVDTTRANDSGSFEFGVLAAGRYMLRAQLPGFKTTETPIELGAGERRRLRLTLHVGSRDDTMVLEPGEWHRAASVAKKLPEAIVLVVARRAGKIERAFQVRFLSGQPSPYEVTSSTLGSALPLDENEYGEIAEELWGFYVTAIHVSLGAERFFPYFPRDLRAAFPPEHWVWRPGSSRAVPSEAEARLRIALMLDAEMHRAWSLLEVAHVPEWDEFVPQEASTESEACALMAENLPAHIASMKRKLQQAGALTAEHRVATRPYLQRLVGYGMLVKEPVPAALQGRWQADSGYRVYLGGLHLYFIRRAGRLELVGAVFD